MKHLIETGKTLINALAFANVDNWSQFDALLAETSRETGAVRGARTAPPPSGIDQPPLAPLHHQSA